MSQPQTLITRLEVQRITGFSRPWIYAQMKRERFPRPVRVGSRAVRWIRSEVEQWVEDRIVEARQRADG